MRGQRDAAEGEARAEQDAAGDRPDRAGEHHGEGGMLAGLTPGVGLRVAIPKVSDVSMDID